MIKRLFCWLWGHRFIIPVYDGGVVRQVTSGVGEHTVGWREVLTYEMKPQRWCRRCGCQNPHYQVEE